MKNLERLAAAAVLTCVIAMTTFGGEVSPPCAPPGEMETPPCTRQMAPDNPVVPAETVTLPDSSTVIFTVTEVTMSALLSALSLV